MKKNAFLFALRHSYPMLVSWFPIALAFGLMMKNAGYNSLWIGLFCISTPCGSLQMVAVSFLTGTVSWLAMILTVAAVTFRHLFYGLSFLERFRRFGKAKWYMIYMLCDELYSLYCSYEIPENVDEKWAHLFTAVLLELYWLVLCMLCCLLGSLLPFDLTGIDFALTALFVVILIDMLRSGSCALPAIGAGISAVLCLLVFGPDRFLIPALLTACAVLILLRKKIEGRTEVSAREN